MANPNWWSTLTNEERQAHVEKMRVGRANRKAKVIGEQINPAPAQVNVIDALREVKWKERTEQQLRWAITVLDEAKERSATELRKMVEKRTGETCGACGGPLPKTGRHFGELSWHDHAVNGIKVLRACSPGCYPKIQAIAEGVRRGAMEQAHSRLSHA